MKGLLPCPFTLTMLDEGLYWLPDASPPRLSYAVGGPFTGRTAAYLWLCAYLEERFTTEQGQTWAAAVAQLGAHPDPAHLMGLALMVNARRPPATILRAAHPIGAWYDAKARAAGERAA